MLGAHFEAEIREQPEVWRRIAASDGAQRVAAAVAGRDILFVGSGSSLFVGMLGALAFRRRGVRAFALAASDARFDNAAFRDACVVALSQSGRSADVLAALDALAPGRLVALTNDAGLAAGGARRDRRRLPRRDRACRAGEQERYVDGGDPVVGRGAHRRHAQSHRGDAGAERGRRARLAPRRGHRGGRRGRRPNRAAAYRRRRRRRLRRADRVRARAEDQGGQLRACRGVRGGRVPARQLGDPRRVERDHRDRRRGFAGDRPAAARRSGRVRGGALRDRRALRGDPVARSRDRRTVQHAGVAGHRTVSRALDRPRERGRFGCTAWAHQVGRPRLMRTRAAAATATTVAVGVLLLLTAQSPSPLAWPTPLPSSAPAPQPTVLWSGAPGVAFALEAEPLGVSPDGEARALVRVVLRDAQGNATRLRRGADFDFFTDRGEAQWQTRLRFGGPAAIVAVRDEGALKVRVGWFPRLRAGAARVYRIDGAGQRTLAAIVHAPASSWDDGAVQPGATMQYAVVRTTETQVVRAAVPAELPASASDALRGKSAWLAFSADPLDDASYLKLDVDRIVATAARAGLRSVELRLAYGAFDETGPAAKPVIDRLIDGFAARRIAVIGWTVPRTTAFEDLARNAEVAAYRTPAGNGITGLAVDLERGEEFLGSGSRGYAALRSYLSVLRRAVGPHVLLVATVEDPFLEHLDQTSFPYREIARDADVLQPMTYWRMLGPWDTIPKVQGAVAESVALVRALAGREIAIDVGAQTGVLSKRGAPPADELAAAIQASRRSGAIGVTFYDLTGTGAEEWETIARTSW